MHLNIQGGSIYPEQAKDDMISVELRRQIDALLTEDRELLRRLAKA